MAYRVNTAYQNDIADAIAGFFDGGTLEIRTGGQPASANDAATGTLLATIDLPSPAFGSASSGQISKSGTWTTTADDSGTAGWFRMISSDTNHQVDGTIGESGSGADAIINNESVVEGGDVTVDSITITQPSGE